MRAKSIHRPSLVSTNHHPVAIQDIHDVLAELAQHLQRRLPVSGLWYVSSPLDAYVGDVDCILAVPEDCPQNLILQAMCSFEPTARPLATRIMARAPRIVFDQHVHSFLTSCVPTWVAHLRPLIGDSVSVEPDPQTAHSSFYWSCINQLSELVMQQWNGYLDTLAQARFARTIDRALEYRTWPANACRTILQQARQLAESPDAVHLLPPSLAPLAHHVWRLLSDIPSHSDQLTPFMASTSVEKEPLYVAKLGVGRHLVVYDFDLPDAGELGMSDFVEQHGSALPMAGQPFVHLQVPLSASAPLSLEVAALQALDQNGSLISGWHLMLNPDALHQVEALAAQQADSVACIRQRITAWYDHLHAAYRFGVVVPPLPSCTHLPYVPPPADTMADIAVALTQLAQ